MTNEATTRAGERVGGMSEAEIDETLAASFPASDPPAWTLGTDHADAEPGPDPLPKRGE